MHGWGGEIASFKGIGDRLCAEFRVILIDLYGFGKTSHPPHPLTIGDYADGVRRLLSEIGVEDAVLVGHSFGGRIAMRLAVRDPRVVGLVLIDSAGILPHRGLKYYCKVASYKIAKRLRLKKLPQGSEDYRRLSGVMKKTFVNVVNESSENDALAIAVPTILLWGRKDKDTPLYMCRKLNALISDSKMIVLDGCGHFSYLERPDFACRVIGAFRKRI